MFLSLFILSILTGYSQKIGAGSKEHASSKEVKNASVIGNVEGYVFVGDPMDGELVVGMYSLEKRDYEKSQTVAFVSSNEQQIPISNAFSSPTGIMLVGELKTEKGIEFYFGFMREGESSNVQGHLFYSIPKEKNVSVHQIKMQMATTQDRLGLSFINSTKNANMYEGNLVLINLEGEVIQKSKFSFASPKLDSKKTILFSTFLSKFEGGLIVFNELLSPSKPNSFGTSIMKLTNEESKGTKTILSQKGVLFDACEFAETLEGNCLIVGFPRANENSPVGTEGFNVVNYDIKRKKVIFEKEVNIGEVEAYRLDYYASEHKEVLAINASHKIISVNSLSDGNAVVFIAGERRDKTADGLVYSSDFLAVNFNFETGVHWNTWVPANIWAAPTKRQHKPMGTPNFSSERNTLVFWGEDRFNVLFRRPVWNKEDAGISFVNYQPFWLSLDPNNGRLSIPEYGVPNVTMKSDDFLNQYFLFSEEEEKSNR